MTSRPTDFTCGGAAAQPRRLWIIAAAGLFVVSAIYGWEELFSLYTTADDEGYVLFSLKNYKEHGGLYDRVYSQYGPFFFLFFDGVTSFFNLPVTHETARFLTLGMWLLAAFLCARTVCCLTRSHVWGIAAFCGHMLYTYKTMIDPMHPGHLIAVLLALAVYLAARFPPPERPGFLPAALGLLTACLLMTKINAGVFFLAAVMLWAAAFGPQAGLFRAARMLAYPLLFLFPFALMYKMLDRPEYQVFAATVALSGLPVFAVVRREVRPLFRWRDVWIYTGAMGAGLLVIGGLIMCSGTSLAGLFEGVALRPLNQPEVYWAAPDWGWIYAGTALTGLALYFFLDRKKRERQAAAVFWPLIILKLGFGFLFLARFFNIKGLLPSGALLPVALWVFLMPLPGWNSPLPGRAGPAFLGLSQHMQLLHAYPVAVSQFYWGTFLYLPVVCCSLHAALRALPERWFVPKINTVKAAVSGMVLIVCLAQFYRFHLSREERLERSVPLDLPGAENIMQPERKAAVLQVLEANAREYASVLFTHPGMGSLNLWSGTPAPTLANATQWWALLDSRQKEAIAGVLKHDPQACVIYNQGLLRWLREARRFRPRDPVIDLIEERFEDAFALHLPSGQFGFGSHHFIFKTTAGRKLEPLYLARLLRYKRMGADGAVPELNAKIELTIPAVPDARLAHAAVKAFGRLEPELLLPLNAACHVKAAEWNEAENCYSEMTARRLPLTLRRKTKIEIYFQEPGRFISPTRHYLLLADETGVVWGKVLFQQ